MAKMKKRPAKKKTVKAKAKKSPKQAAKKTAKKPTATLAPKKKTGAAPAQSKPTAVKKAVPNEEPRKLPASKGIPAMPKEPELDEEEIGEEEIDLSGESEMDEDVDYIEKSDDLIDDSDDYRH